MKKLGLLFLSILLFVQCKEQEEKTIVVNVQVEKDSINVVLDAWHKDAADAKFERYFNGMTKEGIFIGTDASENWTIPEFKDFSKPYFDRGSAWSFTAVERNIYVYEDGKLAWFDELLDTWMGVCRGSGVVKKVNDSWKIEHYVLSMTVPNDNIQGVIDLNKAKDSIFLSRFKK